MWITAGLGGDKFINVNLVDKNEKKKRRQQRQINYGQWKTVEWNSEAESEKYFFDDAITLLSEIPSKQNRGYFWSGN